MPYCFALSMQLKYLSTSLLFTLYLLFFKHSSFLFSLLYITIQDTTVVTAIVITITIITMKPTFIFIALLSAILVSAASIHRRDPLPGQFDLLSSTAGLPGLIWNNLMYANGKPTSSPLTPLCTKSNHRFCLHRRHQIQHILRASPAFVISIPPLGHF